MMSKRDIRAIMLYEFKRDTNAAKTAQQIKETFGRSNEDLGNEERERPESVLDNDVPREAVEANPLTTVREFAKDLNVSKSFY
uniref:HTH_48 domain-containing protein n=1 Tax=Strongyloides papillosus TaxID=174720 RepID=A0A0N5B3N0_STREA